LSRSSKDFAPLAEKLYQQGEQLSLAGFATSTHPSLALDILFKLTRRQVYDFGKSRTVTAFWESLPEAKKLWLWNNDNRWWGYLGFVLMAYCRTNRLSQASSLAKATFEDPSMPRDALVSMLVPYNEELVNRGYSSEALDAFRWIITENPTRAGCATA
jgi:hypothetical protein